ncbi:Nitric oxide responding transcriptional regulator Dnr (Crp/Fnr family) [Levilactobacillus zymae]|uniref:Nitric oxide responding transcriptional regulator Dnr (Crp/Fnr family) n=2 Tax=Levilactobacillus zymae TaxID=267363 RepID=A0A1Y6JYB1_9LACO|nr:Nitric oxide responding transcriptional regulator Dnr (Crp/Fnr family) [Levilactobacillus zymae]
MVWDKCPQLKSVLNKNYSKRLHLVDIFHIKFDIFSLFYSHREVELIVLASVYETIQSNSKVYQLVKTAPLEILEKMTVKRYDTQEFKLAQGSQYPNTYILVAGEVKVYLAAETGKSVVLDIYQPGMFIGEQEAIVAQPYSASIVNISPVTLLQISNADFREWTMRDHRFANSLIYNLSEQIYHLTKRTERYSLYSTRQQIGFCLLTDLTDQTYITREQVTYRVDTSLRNVNRVLKQLAELEIIEINKGRIRLINRQKLQQLIRIED